MPQFDIPLIDPEVTTGTELAGYINSWAAAVESQHSGSTRPTYAGEGMLWLDKSGGLTAWALKLYDGADDITVATINATANTLLGGDGVFTSVTSSGPITAPSLKSASGPLVLGGALAVALTLTGANAAFAGGVTAAMFTGNLSGNAATVTVNANLTGPITSVGNATSVAAQTGTGSTFVMANSPTLTTPTFSGIATGNISGNAATATTAGACTGNAATVTVNANLTGPITSVGNATSVAAQTGTGSTFVMANSPTLNTPTFSGTATGNISGNAGTATTAAACSGNAATATTAGACSGNAATATTAAACSGNAATASACTGNSATATSAAACTGNAATASACTGNSATATSAAACTGNAATATKLQTARNINGVPFDGTADITVAASFAPAFESAELTIVASTFVNAAHGLGRVPKLAVVVARCKVAELGYAVGDEYPMHMLNNTAPVYYSCVIVDGTVIGVMLSNAGVNIPNRTSPGAVSPMTLTSWKIVVRAW